MEATSDGGYLSSFSRVRIWSKLDHSAGNSFSTILSFSIFDGWRKSSSEMQNFFRYLNGSELFTCSRPGTELIFRKSSRNWLYSVGTAWYWSSSLSTRVFKRLLWAEAVVAFTNSDGDMLNSVDMWIRVWGKWKPLNLIFLMTFVEKNSWNVRGFLVYKGIKFWTSITNKVRFWCVSRQKIFIILCEFSVFSPTSEKPQNPR